MKCLIAVTPNGGACSISDIFEGSIDDVAIIEQLGGIFTTHFFLNPGNPGNAFVRPY